MSCVTRILKGRLTSVSPDLTVFVTINYESVIENDYLMGNEKDNFNLWTYPFYILILYEVDNQTFKFVFKDGPSST